MAKGEKTVLEHKIDNVKAWPLRKGKSELLRHLEGGGKPLTAREAIAARCYDCQCGYDATEDCGITTCPLHDFMPYREGGVRKSRTMNEEQRQAAAERFKAARESK